MPCLRLPSASVDVAVGFWASQMGLVGVLLRSHDLRVGSTGVGARPWRRLLGLTLAADLCGLTKRPSAVACRYSAKSFKNTWVLGVRRLVGPPSE